MFRKWAVVEFGAVMDGAEVVMAVSQLIELIHLFEERSELQIG